MPSKFPPIISFQVYITPRAEGQLTIPPSSAFRAVVPGTRTTGSVVRSRRAFGCSPMFPVGNGLSSSASIVPPRSGADAIAMDWRPKMDSC